MSKVRILALLLIAALVAGCGFHLRGTQPLADGWRMVAVKDARQAAGRSGSAATWYGGDRDELQRTVERALAGNGVAIADDAALVVELLGETVIRRASAIGAAASAAEYQLDYELRFRVVDAGQQELMPAQGIRRDRIYRYNEAAAMGSAEEEALLRREMRQAAALQLASQFARRARNMQAPAVTPAPPSAATAAPATPTATGHETAAP